MSSDLRTLLETLEHISTQDWVKKIPPEVLDLSVSEADRRAAWEFYIELVTRVATQPLDDRDGVEVTALESISSLFKLAREVMRKSGPDAVVFSSLAIAILNHRVRPFTAAWHKESAEGRLSDPATAGRFRDDLRELQDDLRLAARALAGMAGVPELSDYSAPEKTVN